MKIKHQLLIAIVAITAIALQSCKKDRTIIEIEKTPNKIRQSVLRVLDKAAPTKQSFTFNASVGGFIYGAGGSQIYFPANALLHQNNTPVTGNVNIEFIEYLNKADMIFSNVTVTSGTDLLESGGMFYLMAKQNGEELKVDPTATIQLLIPKSDIGNNNMDFWQGALKDNDSLNKVDWVKRDSVPIKQVQDSSNQPFKFSLQLNYFKFGYCNIDREAFKFLNKVTKFRIKLPSDCNDTNSSSLLLFKNYNCCAWCYWFPSENLMSTGYSLPKGETIKVLIYKRTGSGDNDLAYAVLEVNLIDDTLVDFTNVTMSACTTDQLEGVIKAL